MVVSLAAPIWLLLLCLALMASTTYAVQQGLFSSLSRRGMVVAALPAIVMVVSFYALALHMRISLGGWPRSIGEAGFSPALSLHAHVADWYFITVFLAAVAGWPIVLLACSIVKRWRRYIAHLSVFGMAFAVCVALMSIGPREFLYWWWD